MPPALYLLLCIVVPFVWGIVSARLFDAWEARRRHGGREAAADPDAADMYYI